MYSFLIQSRSLSYAKIIIIIEMCKYLHSISCARTGLWFGFLFSGYPPICGDFIFLLRFMVFFLCSSLFLIRSIFHVNMSVCSR